MTEPLRFKATDKLLKEILGAKRFKSISRAGLPVKTRRKHNKQMGPFPQNWRDVHAAKATWCEGADGEGFRGSWGQCANVDIFIRGSWLPEDLRESDGGGRVVSGSNLRHALDNLRDNYWPHMRPPQENIND